MSRETTVAADQLQWLIDIEAIKQLKARYCAACDQDYQADQLAEMFTEDDEVPWLWLAAGVGLGILSYGVSAALDGEPAPFQPAGE